MAAELEIHHINVSQGDSTLIINRNIVQLGLNIQDAITNSRASGPMPLNQEDYLPFAIKANTDYDPLPQAAKKNPLAVRLDNTVTAALLIDAGEAGYGKSVSNYLPVCGIRDSDSTLKRQQFYVVATHFHSDHVHGLKDIFFKQYDSKKHDTAQKINFAPLVAYDCGDYLGTTASGSIGKLYTNGNPCAWDAVPGWYNYRSYMNALAHAPAAKKRTKSEVLRPGQTLNILGSVGATPITLTCIASNGIVQGTAPAANVNPLSGGASIDQNARSVVLLLEYGNFRYFLGGDIGGTGQHSGGNFGLNRDNRNPNHYSSHYDIEGPVIPALKNVIKAKNGSPAGHMCGFFVNHHGSASSNDVFLLDAMLPVLAVCSAGRFDNFYKHPTQQLFNRIDSTKLKKIPAPLAEMPYSPLWQKPSNTKTANATVTNTITGYYMTEVAIDSDFGSPQFNGHARNFPLGRILGDIVVRPMSNINTAGHIAIQVYGSGQMTMVDNKGTIEKSSQVQDVYSGAPNQPPYPIGPFTHTCTEH